MAEETATEKRVETKETIRRMMRRKRREADPIWNLKASERIQRAVLRLPEFATARSIGCYYALPYEVQMHLIIQRCREYGKPVCVPAFNEDLNRYELTWTRPDEPLRAGRWNIKEPRSHNRAGFMGVELIVVPALAYDPSGKRLGHGGGHYDRILGAWSGFKIGIAFQFQVVDGIPTGAHDIPVDMVVTERHVYKERYTLR